MTFLIKKLSFKKLTVILRMTFLIKKQSFKKLAVILRVTGKLLLKSKDMCLNEIFELTILMLTFCKNVFLKDIIMWTS